MVLHLTHLPPVQASCRPFGARFPALPSLLIQLLKTY